MFSQSKSLVKKSLESRCHENHRTITEAAGGRGSFFLRKVTLQRNQIQPQVGGNEHTSDMFETNCQRVIKVDVMNLLVPLTFHLLTLTNILSTSDAPNPATLRRCGVFFVHQCHMTPVGQQPWAKHCHMSHI